MPPPVWRLPAPRSHCFCHRPARRFGAISSASAMANIIDRLKSSLFELRPETSDIVCVEGAIIRRSSMV
jgi:hypothetical protein